MFYVCEGAQHERHLPSQTLSLVKPAWLACTTATVFADVVSLWVFYDLQALLFTLYLQQNGVKNYRGATILTFDPHYKQRSFTGTLCNTFFLHFGQQDAQETFSIKLLFIRFFF